MQVKENVCLDFKTIIQTNFIYITYSIKVPSGTVVVTHLFVKKILIKKTQLTMIYE